MLTIIHLILGVITPHIGTVVSGVMTLLKSRQDASIANLKTEDELKEVEIKAEVSEDRLEHKNPDWSDRVSAILRVAVTVIILGLFVYAELSGNSWEDEWHQGLAFYVIGHAMSSGVGALGALMSRKSI